MRPWAEARPARAATRQPLEHQDPRVTALSLDVTDRAEIGAVEAVEPLDVLVNKARHLPRPAPEVLAESWRGGVAKALEHECPAPVRPAIAA